VKRVIFVFFSIGLLANAGCRSRQLAYDQDKFRHAVLDLHTNQIMDNLVRIRRGLPILQVDYIHMTGTITQNANGSLGGSQTVVETGAAVITSITNLFNWSAGASQMNQLTVTAEPVSTPDVYNAYLEFLGDPNHLVEWCNPPSAGQAILVQCYEIPMCGPWWDRHRTQKTYYWVPCEYKNEFLKLALYTAAMRGQTLAVSPEFAVTIKGILGCEMIGGDPDKWTVRLALDTSIPSDHGWMSAVIGGISFTSDSQRIKVLPDEQQPNDPTANAGSAAPQAGLGPHKLMSYITVSISLADLGNSVPGNAAKPLTIAQVTQNLSGQKVGIRLERSLPGTPTTDRLLEGIRSQLELSRLQGVH
jgi:hypothetical protein